jgi:hypothetical protein
MTSQPGPGARLVGHSSTLMTCYYASADMRRLRKAVHRL